jgi:dTDP-4-dehydrorhamnose reductase
LGSEVVKQWFPGHGTLLAPTRKELDLTDTTAARDYIHTHHPDSVINCAAWSDVDGCERDPVKAMDVNSEVPKLLAQACAETDAMLVHVSSDYCAFTELSVYAQSKLMGEFHVRSLLPKTGVVVRVSCLLSPHPNGWVAGVLRMAREGLVRVASQITYPTTVATAAKALLYFATEATSLELERTRGYVNITDKPAVSRYALANRIAVLAYRGTCLPFDMQEVPPDILGAFRPVDSRMAGPDDLFAEDWREALPGIVNEALVNAGAVQQ